MADRPDSAKQINGLQPGYPRTVLAAGIIWIVYGCFLLLGLAFLSLALLGPSAGREQHEIPVLFAVCLSLSMALFGVLFVHVGVQSVRGTARDTLGNGIASIILSLVFLASLRHAARDESVTTSILLGCGLLAAGILALLGRKRYKAWREVRKAEQDAGGSRVAEGRLTMPPKGDGTKWWYRRTAVIAGAVFIVFGSFLLLLPLHSLLGQLGPDAAQPDAREFPAILCRAVLTGLFGLVLTILGVDWVLGPGSRVRKYAALSAIFGVLWIVCCLSCSATAADGLPRLSAGTIRCLLPGGCLLSVGVLVLLGHRYYRAWRESRKLKP